MLSRPFPVFELPSLVLASGSPRRAEILTAVGWPFIKHVPDIDESELENESPEEYVARLAKAKASAVSALMPNELVLGADTTVVIDGRIIGKPGDLTEAAEMLRLLSGRWHSVLTGIAVACGARLEYGVQNTRVRFSEMNDTEIDFLVRHGKPLDKAGAYAVQAQAALFIEGIEGDYWNVVGLPVKLLYETVSKIIYS